MAITFRARKPDTATNTEGMVAIEVVKDGYPLGVWLITKLDARNLYYDLEKLDMPESETSQCNCAAPPGSLHKPDCQVNAV